MHNPKNFVFVWVLPSKFLWTVSNSVLRGLYYSSFWPQLVKRAAEQICHFSVREVNRGRVVAKADLPRKLNSQLNLPKA